LHHHENTEINCLGKLKDKKLELEYERQEYLSLKRLLTVLFVTLGLLFTAFIIPEIFSGGLKGGYIPIVAARLVMLAAFLVFSVVINLNVSVKAYKIFLTALEFVFPVSYFYIIYQSGQLDFLFKCFDIILIMTVIFLIPNDWHNAFAAAFFTLLSFLIFSHIVIAGLGDDAFYAGVTYLTLLFLIAGAFSLIINHFKRRQFLNQILLKRIINTDYLTEINSRVHFDEVCREFIALSKRNNKPLSLAVFDIDDFKRINDTYGHLSGDRVLIRLASLVSENLFHNEFFARWGGEEFVLLFPGCGLRQAVGRTNDIKYKINGFAFEEGITLTCSFGVAELDSRDDLDTLVDKADNFMYAAKRAGKNLVVFDGAPQNAAPAAHLIQAPE
jgi:two-component system cell cycle response regulator